MCIVKFRDVFDEWDNKQEQNGLTGSVQFIVGIETTHLELSDVLEGAPVM